MKDASESEARLADQCRAQAEQRQQLEKGLRDAAAAHTGFASQLKNAKSRADDQRRKLEQSRAAASASASRIRALEEECGQARLTIASLETKVGREDELARTATHLHAELAKREQTAKAQGRILAKARGVQERAATKAKALQAELQKSVSAHEYELEQLREKLGARNSALAVAAAHRESSEAMTAALLHLTATTCVRWLGGAAELAVAHTEHKDGTLDAPTVARLANELPLDIGVTVTSSKRIQVRPGPNADPDVAGILRSILNKIVRAENPESSEDPFAKNDKPQNQPERPENEEQP